MIELGPDTDWLELAAVLRAAGCYVVPVGEHGHSVREEPPPNNISGLALWLPAMDGGKLIVFVTERGTNIPRRLRKEPRWVAVAAILERFERTGCTMRQLLGPEL